MRTHVVLKGFIAVTLWAACILAMARGQERPDPIQSPKRDPTSRIWSVPGMKVSESGMTVYVVSNECDGWIVIDGNRPESISRDDAGPNRDAKRFNRGCALRVGGKSGAWSVYIYQARSRRDAVEYGNGIITTTSGSPIPNQVWDSNAIGEMSVGFNWVFPPERWSAVVFIRGNVLVAVFSNESDANDRTIHDPRPIAASIDSYVRRIPAVDHATEDVTLALEGASKSDGNIPSVVLGRPYVVTGLHSRGMPDANGLLSVSKWQTISDPNMDANRTSEVQVRTTNADVTNPLGGRLQVEFKAPGKQRIECWFVNAKGNATAYGRLEVMVTGESGDTIRSSAVVRGCPYGPVGASRTPQTTAPTNHPAPVSHSGSYSRAPDSRNSWLTGAATVLPPVPTNRTSQGANWSVFTLPKPRGAFTTPWM